MSPKKSKAADEGPQPERSCWLDQDPVYCEQCDQDTHSLERDAPPDKPKYLLWTTPIQAQRDVDVDM